MKSQVIIISILSLIMGCSDSGSKSDWGLSPESSAEGFSRSDRQMMKVVEQENVPVTEEADEIAEKMVPRKVIKRGFAEIRSENVERSKSSIDSLTKRFDSYIAAESYSEGYDRYTYNITIRIGAEMFDQFLASLIAGPDVIKTKSVNVSDVTEQYYDLSSRLENNKAVEARYRELLGRATTVKDILEIERSLGEIRGEIESQQGRLNRLNSEIAYSTLEIVLYQEKSPKESAAVRDPFLKRVGKAVSQGWSGFITFLVFLIRIWPLWLILITGWRVMVHFRKKRSK